MSQHCWFLLLSLCTLVVADVHWDYPTQNVVVSVNRRPRGPSYKFSSHPNLGSSEDFQDISSGNKERGEFSYFLAYNYKYPEKRKYQWRQVKYLYYGGFELRMYVCKKYRSDTYTVTQSHCQGDESEVLKFYVSEKDRGDNLPGGLRYQRYNYGICRYDSREYSRIVTDNTSPCFKGHTTLEQGTFYAFAGEMFCPDRPVPAKSRVYGVHRPGGVFLETITYKCDYGYNMDGPATVTCNRGSWSRFPKCRKITCDPPREPRHAKPVTGTYDVGATLVFECETGYQLHPRDASIQCMDKGRWTTRDISCELTDCGYPHNFENGNANVRGQSLGTKYGAVIEFQCDEGYRLKGASSAKCLESGQWSERVPTCGFIECDTIYQPDHGSVVVNGVGVGSTAIFRCHPGYRRVGSEILHCEERSQAGVWNPSRIPYCDKLTCPDLNDPENGDVVVIGRDHGETSKYSCNPGYILKGTETRSCQNGQWDGEAPTCQIVSCNDPGMLRNGVRGGTELAYGNMLTYSCDLGYTMIGSKAQVCSETGQWEPREQPRCEIVQCAPLRNPDSGSVDASGVKFNSEVKFKCNPGYQLVGEDAARCQDDGQWDNLPPTCKACPMGYYKEGSNGNACEACPERSTTVTEASHQRELCQCEEGTSGPAGGPCRSVSCPELTPPENGGMNPCGTGSGAECDFFCDPGYILKGQRSRRCTAQGWTGIAPVCEACPENKYKAGPRVTSCMPCPVNSVTRDRLGKSIDDCWCAPGYNRTEEDASCTDVNECEINNGGCEQQCENTPGSFQCSCSIPGYELNENGQNCTLKHFCKELDQPVEHGHLKCVHSRAENGIICHINCDQGYFFVSGINDYFTCGVETKFGWSHQRVNATARIPACTKEYYVDLQISYSVTYTIPDSCEAFSVDPVQFMTVYQNVLDQNTACNGSCSIHDVNSVCQPGGNGSDHVVSFKMFILNPDRNAVEPDCNRNCQRRNLMSMASTSSEANKELYKLVTGPEDSEVSVNLGTDTEPIPIKPNSFKRARSDLLCPEGRVFSKYRLCVPCDKGTYIPRRDLDTCLPCPVGTYQNQKGQTKCELCIPSTTTVDVGSDHAALCNKRVPENPPFPANPVAQA